MPNSVNFFWGLQLFFDPILPSLPGEETTHPLFEVEPRFGLQWHKTLITGNIQTKQAFRNLIMGSSEYQSQIGLTTVRIDVQQNCYRKDNYEIFGAMGAGIQLPSISITTNSQSTEDITLITDQFSVDFFAAEFSLGLGVKKHIGSLFIGIQNQQNLIWNPVFSDDFGTENHFELKSQASLIFGWLM